MYAVGYEVYHHLYSTECKFKLINFNQHNLRIYIQDPHFLWPRIVRIPFS
jgi:hypothetical protein